MKIRMMMLPLLLSGLSDVILNGVKNSLNEGGILFTINQDRDDGLKFYQE